MFRRNFMIVLAVCCLLSSSAGAQEAGSAAGKGTIERLLPTGDSEKVSFSPRYSYADSENLAGQRFTGIVLTEKEPPVKAWAAAKDPAEARRLWCEGEKASFVAVKLDPEWKVDLYFSCPGNGGLHTAMLSTWNGLDSVVMKLDVREGKRLKGTLRAGEGACSGEDGATVYCTATGDYEFDASLIQ